jgi:hypothetical protein
MSNFPVLPKHVSNFAIILQVLDMFQLKKIRIHIAQIVDMIAPISLLNKKLDFLRFKCALSIVATISCARKSLR